MKKKERKKKGCASYIVVKDDADVADDDENDENDSDANTDTGTDCDGEDDNIVNCCKSGVHVSVACQRG